MPHRTRLLLLTSCVACLGCWSERYEQEFRGNTLPYFEYRQTLDSALQLPWSRGGVTLRPPLEAREIPPPKEVESEDEAAPVEQPVDPRQIPEFGELPGLKAAWSQSVEVDVAGGRQRGRAVILLLTAAGIDDEGVEDFGLTVVDRVAAALGYGTITPEQMRTMRFPQTPQPFATQVAYTAVRMKAEVDGRPSELTAYVHNAGGRDAVLLTVVPDDVLGVRDLRNALELMLQTLEVGSPGTRRSPSGGGGAAAPTF